jgi:3'-5' exoribonuclease
MGRQFVDQLADGDAVDDVYLVTDKQLRANRNGNLYLQLDLRDRSGAINARMWNVSEPLARTFEAGDFLHARGKVQLFQGALQIILAGLEPVAAPKIDLTDFLPHTPQDVNKLLDRLRGYLLKQSNPHLRALAECFLMDDEFVSGFRQVPAGVKVHHAYVGGLLEHVVTMMDGADRLLPLYPGVDRDLVLTGVFLHDSGKVRELTYGRAFAYTDEGQLIGHLNIGVEMLNEKAAKVPDLTGEPFPRELLLRVKHMILSHHGSLEYGSPKVPMTLEAIALHALDMLDTRMHIFLREIRDDRNAGSAWTQYNPALERRIFKGGAARGDSFQPAMSEAFD